MACKGCGNNSNGVSGKGKIKRDSYAPYIKEKYTTEGEGELIIKDRYSLPKRIKVTAKMRRTFMGNRSYTISKRVSIVDNRLIWFLMNNSKYKQWLDIEKMTAIEETETLVTDIKISPKAAALAIEHNIDISQVAGSGKNGSITLSDIKRVI